GGAESSRSHGVARAHGVLGQGLTPAFSMGMTSLLVPGTMLPPARPGSHPIVTGGQSCSTPCPASPGPQSPPMGTPTCTASPALNHFKEWGLPQQKPKAASSLNALH
uniref:Uncharacterized protein n=1 Tax=Anser cygnoides TaxID=8845 RepID=A0A8B9EDA5_ANSCY